MAYLNQKTRIIAVGGKQVNADWNETNPLSPAYIQNKPDISGALTRQVVDELPTENIDPNCIYMVPNDDHYDEYMYINGSWEKIGDTSVAQVQSDWDEADPTSPAYIDNKPTLATVATSGSYADLSNTPSLATVATSGSYTDLSNTPSLATVATSGSYTDLSNTPTIPTVNDATITIQQDGTTVGTFTTNDANDTTINLTGGSSENNWYGTQEEFITLELSGQLQEDTNYYIEGELARVATSGDFNDLSNRPTAAVAFSNSYNDLNNTPTPLQTVLTGRWEADWYGTQAEFDALEQAGKLSWYTNYYIEGEGGGGTQVQSDWNETDTTDPAYILNKPTIPTVGDGTVSFYHGINNPLGSITMNQSGNASFDIKPATQTVSGSPAIIAAVGGKVYKCTTNLTALQVSSAENTSVETLIYFHTSISGCTMTLPSTLDKVVGNTTLVADKDYIVSIKDNVAIVSNASDTLSTVAYSGSYNDLSDKPTIGTGVTSLYYGSTDNLIGSWNANQTSTGGQVIKPQSVTITTSTVTTDVKGGRVYDCTVDITALNLTTVEDNPCETDIYFHTSSNGCTFTYPNTLDNIIGSTALTAGKDYRIRVKDNVMEIINLEYTMPTNIVTGYNGNSYVVRYISQTDYDNLGTYDANTIYLIY